MIGYGTELLTWSLQPALDAFISKDGTQLKTRRVSLALLPDSYSM